MRYERFSFGSPDLAGGFQLIPVLVGAFGFSEVLTVMSERGARPKIMELGSALPRIMDVLRYWRTIIRSGVIGVWVGILPGVGEDMAGMVVLRHCAAAEQRAGKIRQGLHRRADGRGNRRQCFGARAVSFRRWRWLFRARRPAPCCSRP